MPAKSQASYITLIHFIRPCYQAAASSCGFKQFIMGVLFEAGLGEACVFFVFLSRLQMAVASKTGARPPLVKSVGTHTRTSGQQIRHNTPVTGQRPIHIPSSSSLTCLPTHSSQPHTSSRHVYSMEPYHLHKHVLRIRSFFESSTISARPTLHCGNEDVANQLRRGDVLRRSLL